MKQWICTSVGTVGSFLAWLFGGWDTSVITLLIFMAIDFASGLIVAGVFHKSKKTENGTLESHTGWKGLCKKCMVFLFVLIGNQLDTVIGTTYIRDAVCIGFIANELISIIENAGLMGIPIPSVITNSIEMLKNGKDDKQDGENN